ncbi:uncharacterized protein CC84DRAFT_1163549 [Paraphaeosphaeria sporulosa]|uniref:Trichothecene 3-O-acetyltransferas-like protein n=1 Tax=Paraphaeosphaeria sporulosa TaxID=1460663 RepID=A0A177CIK9_9PLEO|nr:uncharacterized protein CC84DRAFT_1163549 [Paraphaeosphaeria sporulosa]OAG07343.1 hypothetical protein CC84DRAFT_1163549 [Paraphaeosphaeria sporulosa]
MAPAFAPTLLDTLSLKLRSFPRMILKSPTPATVEERLHLSALDQNIVRVYTQVFLIFPFPDANQREIAIQALESGLQATLQSFPFLAGTLRLANDSSGKLVLTFPTHLPDCGASGVFAWKTNETFRTYEDLKEGGMPPDAFPGSKLRPDDFGRYPGIPPDGEGLVNFDHGNQAPVMRVQADFIPGGLILSTYVHHTVMDFAGINIFWKCFAENVSSLSLGRRIIPGLAADYGADQRTMRRQVDNRAPTYACGQSPCAEAYVEGTYKYEKSLPDDTECTMKYLIISAARIRNYRDDLRKYFPGESPPTICNVIAALLWIHVTRARAHRRGDCGKEETKIGIATDLRKRMSPPLQDNYTGNMAIFSTGALDVHELTKDELVTEETIVCTIKEIRRTIAKVDNDWVSNHLGFFKSVDTITDTELGLGFRFGMDIYITSWMNFGADLQWGIPGTDMEDQSLGGRPEFIRRSYGVADGGMMIMPRRRHQMNGNDAPYEVMVRLAKVDMERLLQEKGGLSQWAERII